MLYQIRSENGAIVRRHFRGKSRESYETKQDALESLLEFAKEEEGWVNLKSYIITGGSCVHPRDKWQKGNKQ